MATEAGHAPNRAYMGQDGAVHVNGAAVFNDDEVDVSDGLRGLQFSGSVAVAGGTLAIPVTHKIVLKTTGGAEALTLADGKPGQILVITLVTDGGDGTLTPSRKTGFLTIVFADAKDTASLQYVDDTIGWVILGTAGIPAPPVIS